MSYSQTLSNSFCTLTDVFLYCTLSDAFFYPTNSILLDIIRHTVLFFTYAWQTISHCSSIGVWRYSQKYLTLKDVGRFDNNAPFFSTSCIKAIKKCRSSQAKYRQITWKHHWSCSNHNDFNKQYNQNEIDRPTTHLLYNYPKSINVLVKWHQHRCTSYRYILF